MNKNTVSATTSDNVSVTVWLYDIIGIYDNAVQVFLFNAIRNAMSVSVAKSNNGNCSLSSTVTNQNNNTGTYHMDFVCDYTINSGINILQQVYPIITCVIYK